MERTCRVQVVVNGGEEARLELNLRLEGGTSEMRLHCRSMGDAQEQLRRLAGTINFPARLVFCPTVHCEEREDAQTGELMQRWREVLAPALTFFAPQKSEPPPFEHAAAEAAREAERDAREETRSEDGEASAPVRGRGRGAAVRGRSRGKKLPVDDPLFETQVATIRAHMEKYGAAPDLKSRKPANIPKIRNYMVSVLADPKLTTERALQVATALDE